MELDTVRIVLKRYYLIQIFSRSDITLFGVFIYRYFIRCINVKKWQKIQRIGLTYTLCFSPLLHI